MVLNKEEIQAIGGFINAVEGTYFLRSTVTEKQHDILKNIYFNIPKELKNQ